MCAYAPETSIGRNQILLDPGLVGEGCGLWTRYRESDR